MLQRTQKLCHILNDQEVPSAEKKGMHAISLTKSNSNLHKNERQLTGWKSVHSLLLLFQTKLHPSSEYY